MCSRVALLLSAIVALYHVAFSHNQGKIGCYYSSWASYRTGYGTYNSSNIDPFACSRIYYGLIGLNASGDVVVMDPHNDLEENYGKGTIKKINDLKKINPELKTFAVFGGWNAGSKDFSVVAADPLKRNKFASSILKFIIQYGFDGCDLDWEYPGRRHDLPHDDPKNFNLLLKAIKDMLSPHSYELHISVSGSETPSKQSYDFTGLAEHGDQINIMAYDFHVGSGLFVDFNAPLYPSKRDTTAQAKENCVDSALKFWSSVISTKKLCLGVPFYGNSFLLADPTNTAPGAPSKGPGPAGSFTQGQGITSYNELCLQWQTETWTKEFDEDQQVPYAHRNGVWVSYDNAKSIFAKGQLALKYNIQCANFWSLDTDDFHGLCGEGKSSLLYSLKRGINTPLPKTATVPFKKEEKNTIQKITRRLKSCSRTLRAGFKVYYSGIWIEGPNSCIRYSFQPAFCIKQD